MKKSKSLIIIGIALICIVGCDSSNSQNREKVNSSGNEINTNQMGHKHCTRQATAGTGVEVSLNYDLYYKGDILNILHSEEKVMSASNETLDTYENAYRGIHKNYEGLEYYDAKVERGDTTVTSDITINYEKINMKALLAIEGEEDNIIENGQAKVSKWIELAEKFGTTCEEIQD